VAFIQGKKLNFAYPHSNNVIKNITFNIDKGSFTIVLGPSGSGKSTLLKQLKPSVTPYGHSTGILLYEEKPLTQMSLREQTEKIAYVSQDIDAQLVTDKVWHELAFTLENLGLSKDVIERRIAEMTAFFGMTQWLDKDVSCLSGGEKQRLVLASALMSQPELLLLDEPVSQLDPVIARELVDLLSRVNRELGITVVISEHQLDLLLEVASHCVVLENGRCLYSGEISGMLELIGQEHTLFSYLPEQTRLSSLCFHMKNVVTVNKAKTLLDASVIPCGVLENKTRITSSPVLMNLSHLWFRYERQLPDLLWDLSFQLKQGDFTVLLGANGSGKSTLLNLIAGVEKPDRGKHLIRGSVGYLPQNPITLFTKNTVLEELKVFDKPIDNIINRLQLTNLLYRHPYDLSGGEMHLVALGKVLLTDPDLLLLDEPTKGMDVSLKSLTGRVLKAFNQNGGTIMMATHDLSFAAANGELGTMLFNGNILPVLPLKRLLSENYFYTTNTARITRDKIKGAVLFEDAISYIQKHQ